MSRDVSPGVTPGVGPDAGKLCEVVAATWPAAAAAEIGPFVIRDGGGGGRRVSAATARRPVTADELPAAEAAMRALGQTPLFMVRDGEAALDALLGTCGYRIVDPVNIHAAPVARLGEVPVPPVTCFTIREPLAIMRDIWAEGGIGPARVAVMHRAAAPRTALLGRTDKRPAAAAFCAIHDGVAMVHALEVRPRHRRSGMGGHLMRQAALWAAGHGASHVAAVCTRDNAAANALYASLGMTVVGQYHYRQKDM